MRVSLDEEGACIPDPEPEQSIVLTPALLKRRRSLRFLESPKSGDESSCPDLAAQSQFMCTQEVRLIPARQGHVYSSASNPPDPVSSLAVLYRRQQTFVSALGNNLEEAAKVDPVSLQLLTTAAEAVKTEGITVKYTEEPRVSLAFVAAADTSTEEPGGNNVVLNALAAIFGVLAAACCAVAVIWQIRRNKQMVDPVTPMADEPASQHSAREL
eukprot:s775_g5.t1